MIIGINVVIANEKSDNHFDYYGKCPHCGYVEKSGTKNAWVAPSSRGPLGTRTCTKCKTTYKMEAENRR